MPSEKIISEVISQVEKSFEIEKDMLPLKTIEDLIKKHTSLEKELSSGEVDKKLFAEKSKYWN